MHRLLYLFFLPLSHSSHSSIYVSLFDYDAVGMRMYLAVGAFAPNVLYVISIHALPFVQQRVECCRWKLTECPFFIGYDNDLAILACYYILLSALKSKTFVWLTKGMIDYHGSLR